MMSPSNHRHVEVLNILKEHFHSGRLIRGRHRAQQQPVHAAAKHFDVETPRKSDLRIPAQSNRQLHSILTAPSQPSTHFRH